MECNGWENILIDWVNCLQLSNTIKDLNELKNGEFFSHLLAVITQDKNLNDADILTIIFKILKKEYPHCQIDNEKTVHIQDLTNNDIIIISSLLMHYSCVFEHRDVLTSPLCQKLSHHTQLCIRMFLEKIHNDVTNDTFFETIKNCIFVNESKKKMHSSQWMSGGDSPLTSRSPLQALLYTPEYKKVYIQKRDREINKLRQELEVERYEKLDYQEELKQQQEHNEKIGKELSEKIAEIKKLRSELIASQYASPFKSDDHFSQDLQRRLKGEIKNLEEYVSQLESEIEKLQNERSSLNANLIKVETEYSTVRDKCLNSEHKYESLLEKYEIQKSELRNLHQHCNELTTLLEELKNSKSNDSYIEVESINSDYQKLKSTQPVSSENLAHAVVEVQLRESLKENNDLKSILKATKEFNNTLQDNIDIGNKKLKELNKQCEHLQLECQELTNKVSILHKTQSALEETKTELAKLTQTVMRLDTEKNALNMQIDSLGSHLNLTKNLLSESESEKQALNNTIEQLQDKITVLDKRLYEKDIACNAFEKESKELQKDLDGLSENLQRLKSDYEDQTKIKETLTEKNCQLEEHLKELENREIQFNELHKRLIGSCKDLRSRLETLITERNFLETLSTNLVKTFNSVQNKVCSITDSKALREKNQTLEILSVDIHKQLEKLSKNLYKISLNAVLNIENVLTQRALTSHASSTEPEILQIDFEEKLEEINDLKDRANDILEQLKTFEKTVDNFIATKSLKPQKETVLLQETTLMKEEEYKKKNIALKQKLTLAENAKANLEKKIKQLREDNKKLIEKSHPENDIMYKQLLEEHKKTKNEYERILQDCNKQYEALYKEYEDYKLHKDVKSEPINIKTEKDVEMESIQEAYSKLLNEKYSLEKENETLHSILKEKNSDLTNVELLKENYTKLLEEKTRLKTELDTMKYKRTRDREDYMQIINREREKEAQKIQEIRNKYDAKLDLLKQRMITLYNDELEKETQKKLEERTENEQLSNIVKNLRIELERSNKKIAELENRYRIEKETESYFRHIENNVRTSSRESLQVDGFRESVTRLKNNISDYKRDLQFQSENDSRYKVPLDDVFDVPDSRTIVRKRITEQKPYSTLPKSIGTDVIKELTISKKTSLSSLQHHPIGQSLKMEDEESDLFNNKYLTDLKEGRCTLASNKESNVERLSELKWRNSLCPPHLKSSYPAETQFNSPSQFKEEDVKTGVLDFDDSISTKLLPGEKARKKDIGTTSYKKPGPPTPSKNGGRVSLQGNEIHSKDVLREHNDKTPKRTTPSRLRALFMGRSSISTNDNSENQPGTSKGKTLSIFRRPR